MSQHESSPPKASNFLYLPGVSLPVRNSPRRWLAQGSAIYPNLPRQSPNTLVDAFTPFRDDQQTNSTHVDGQSLGKQLSKSEH
jgi:hypothetical protein